MSDELQRAALARSIGVRLHLCSLGETRLLDVVLQVIEQLRAGGDRRWERRIATGRGDSDSVFHLVRQMPSSGVVTTLCNGSWGFADRTEAPDSPPLDERCEACWRAACGGSAIGMALLDVVGQIAIHDRDTAELREQARAEMVGESAGEGR